MNAAARAPGLRRHHGRAVIFPDDHDQAVVERRPLCPERARRDFAGPAYGPDAIARGSRCAHINESCEKRAKMTGTPNRPNQFAPGDGLRTVPLTPPRPGV